MTIYFLPFFISQERCPENGSESLPLVDLLTLFYRVLV